MQIFKISFLLRDPSVGYDYKEKFQRELAEDLAQALLAELMPSKPIRKSRGSVQHHFYVATEHSAEQHKVAVAKLLEKLLPDQEQRRQVLVSVTEPSGEELAQLRQGVNVEENKAFWQVAEGKIPTTNPANAKPVTTSVESAPVQTTTAQHAKENRREEENEPETNNINPLTLTEQAQRLQALKEGLLQKVRGQRHAVDQVVQSFFESQMFASINEARKGPLATFLFTGPSGVGKTYLAELCGKLMGREMLIVDMSEYSDNLANMKFNGEHNQPAVVTTFARKHPDGIIVFDEVEKAHINTIHLFLQILDAARLMDNNIRKEVSFRNNIIIMTTNAGKALYEDSTVCDLSATPRSVILEALRTDRDPSTQVPFFPECITTRMANGNVILFNHLEPYALLQIIQDEIELQMQLFEKSSGIKVNYDPVSLAALVLYNGGGAADARTLRGLARSIVVRELQQVVMQAHEQGPERLKALKNITITLATQEADSVKGLFSSQDRMQVVALTDKPCQEFEAGNTRLDTDFLVLNEADSFKRRVRGVTDYVLIDPLCGCREMDRLPNDIEDLDSVGMDMFRYVREVMPELPVYIYDSRGNGYAFESLLARGARGVICPAKEQSVAKALRNLSFTALVNNAVYGLGRSGKFLSFDCAQYFIDESCAVVAFEKLQIKNAPLADDKGVLAQKGNTAPVKFTDIIGCKAAKEALSEYKQILEDPRKTALSGKKMPKGVLLYGPPGTGKTMLAKAMANECNATFIPTTATAFFGSLVGQTEQNIRDLFKKARKYAPSIIFVDEVDAIGRIRTGSTSSVHNEDALNTFLAEMDGFVVDEKRPVFVLAATNYGLEGDSGRVLDPAFVRRFDRKILIPLPDTDDRYALLEKSLKRHGIHFGKNHQQVLKNMAQRTSGMNNADLEMLNAHYVRSLGDKEPDGAGYMDSLDSYRYGEVNKMDPEQLRQTACHEAGHALVCKLCGVTPSFLTIVSRGRFGGYMSAGSDKGTYTYQELMDRVCLSLAGRVAEIELYGEQAGNNTGASSDIRHARYLMKTSLNDYAMGTKLYSRWSQDEIETEMQLQYQRTKKLIAENRDILIALTDLLTEKKAMDQAQLEEFFQKVNI